MANRTIKSVGLNISSRSVEAVELILENKKIRIGSLGRKVLDPGVVDKGRIKNMPLLASAVKEVLANAKPRPIKTDEITFAYPEAQTYTQVISLNANGKEASKQIREQVLAALPIKENDLQYNYRLLKPGDNSSQGKKVLLLATSQVVVMEWQQFFSRLNLEIIGFISESVAAYFGLFDKYQATSKCIIDLGAKTVISSFFNADGLVYSFSYYQAGDYVNKEIVKAQNIDDKEAERLKINFGSKASEKTKEIINKYFKAFGAELKINFNEYQKYTNDKPDEIILVGGGAKLRGVEDLIGNAGINIPIQAGKPNLPESGGPEFVVALGLARLGLDPGRNMDNFLVWDKDRELSKRMFLYYFKRARKKFNFNKRIFSARLLIALGLIIGSIIIFSSYLLLSSRSNVVPEVESKYPFLYTLPLSVPITIVQDENVSTASGRIIKVTVNEAGNLEDAIAKARVTAGGELAPGEALWSEPLNDFSSSQIFPLSISFFVYNDREARTGLSDLISETLKGGSFLIDKIIFLSLSKGLEKDIFKLEASVKLHSNITPDILEEKKQKIVDEKQIFMLQINNIGQALNIRSGPGTGFAVVGQALAGGYYKLLKEGKDWHEIQFDKVSNGWVYANFTTIIKE